MSFVNLFTYLLLFRQEREEEGADGELDRVPGRGGLQAPRVRGDDHRDRGVDLGRRDGRDGVGAEAPQGPAGRGAYNQGYRPRYTDKIKVNTKDIDQGIQTRLM